MGARDHVEKALRELHVILSQCEIYDEEKSRVIVDKKRFVDALNDLNQGIYEVMDEYEYTKSSRDQAERETKKRGDEIIRNATRQAEDVYAASVLYTDEAKEGINLITSAGIHTIMITGDSLSTASTIAKEIGILKKTKTTKEIL